MKTTDLISVLVQDQPHKKLLPVWIFTLIFFILSAAITYFTIGLRPELVSQYYPLGFWIKTSLLLFSVVFGTYLLEHSLLPRIFIVPKMPFIFFALIFVVLILQEWLTTPFVAILNPALVTNFICCVFFVCLYAVCGAFVMGQFLRRYAPLDAGRAAGLMGYTAASAGALGYSFHCPVDSPTFIALAYGLPVSAFYILTRKFFAEKLNW